MTYTLDLYFKPAVERRRILQYLASRKRYKVDKDNENEIVYDNPDTGIGFFLTLRPARTLFRSKIKSAEFTINYYRPSYFGLEGEIELSTFIAALQPQIEDPQLHGMDMGPYSREGFLNGWSFGNLFCVHNILEDKPDHRIPTMPGEKVRAAWAWNYRYEEQHERLRNRRYVPQIRFVVMEGRVSTVAVWPRGVPISLPKVDYVAVIRDQTGNGGFGFVPWSEVVELAGRAEARFDLTKDPLDLEYFVTPPAIAKWVSEVPLVDINTIERLKQHHIMDAEIVEAARKAKRVGDSVNLTSVWRDLVSPESWEPVVR